MHFHATQACMHPAQCQHLCPVSLGSCPDVVYRIPSTTMQLHLAGVHIVHTTYKWDQIEIHIAEQAHQDVLEQLYTLYRGIVELHGRLVNLLQQLKDGAYIQCSLSTLTLVHHIMDCEHVVIWVQ